MIRIFAIAGLVVFSLGLEVNAEPISGFTDGGLVGLTVSNQGRLGHAFSNRSPNCEYPIYSNVEHLYLGGIWVGARTPAGDVLVSTSAQDANGIVAHDEIREFQEWDGPMGSPSFRRISNQTSNDNFHPDALADDHIECIFADDVVASYLDHTSLGLKVTLKALSWSPMVIDDFVILDYTLENVSGQPLYDLYFGFFNDTTVGNTTLTNPYDYNAPILWNYNDDMNGGWRPGDFPGDPTIWMMHERDADAEYGFAPNWVGCRLLGTEPQVVPQQGMPPVSYNCWRFRGVPEKDDWYVEAGDTTNTLLPGKYQIMSNGHFDIGVTPEEDFTRPSNWLGLLSTGPFPYLAAGDSIRVVFALTLGVDGYALRYNSRNAKLLFDSGYEMPLSAVEDVPASQCRLDPPFPNPFNPSTRIGFTLSTADLVTLSIHDLRGHLIRTLDEGHRDSGHHSAVWDGRDNSGQAVASGSYFVRLLAGRESSTAKVVLRK